MIQPDLRLSLWGNVKRNKDRLKLTVQGNIRDEDRLKLTVQGNINRYEDHLTLTVQGPEH